MQSIKSVHMFLLFKGQSLSENHKETHRHCSGELLLLTSHFALSLLSPTCPQKSSKNSILHLALAPSLLRSLLLLIFPTSGAEMA